MDEIKNFKLDLTFTIGGSATYFDDRIVERMNDVIQRAIVGFEYGSGELCFKIESFKNNAEFHIEDSNDGGGGLI